MSWGRVLGSRYQQNMSPSCGTSDRAEEGWMPIDQSDADDGADVHSLHTILQFPSVSLFEKTSIPQAFSNIAGQPRIDKNGNRLLLFEL